MGIVEKFPVEDGHEKILDLQVLVKEDTIEYIDLTLVSLHKYPQEDIPFRYAIAYTYLFKYWISEYIVEIEAQGCTRIDCECKECLLRHAMEEGPHELPMWKGTLNLEYVADYIPCKSENKITYPFIDWLERGITEEENLEGKSFMSCCKKFVFNIADFSMIYK